MNINPRSILGGIPGLFEDDFEYEKEPSSIASVAGDVLGDIFSLGKDITGIEKSHEASSFPSTGSIEFNKKEQENAQAQQAEQKKQKESARKNTFFQNIKEDQERAKRAKEILLFEEEINDISANLPTDQ